MSDGVTLSTKVWRLVHFIIFDQIIPPFLFFIIINPLTLSPGTDVAIGRIHKTCEEHNYILMITSDHGNAEKMFSEQGGPHTAHTTFRGKVV